MNLLIIDSSNANLSIVVVKDQTVYTNLIRCSLNHSKIITDAVSSLCITAGICLDDVDVFGVCVGPGSFTGIRIGIATVKGYNFAFKKKIVSVNSLEVLSYTVKNSEVKCFVPDGKSGFYFTSFNNHVPSSEFSTLSSQECEKLSKEGDCVTYDDSMNLCMALVEAVKAKIGSGNFNSNPQALYIRKCQAEIEKELKNVSNN